jgi:signal transduction histidine kinase
MLLFVLLALDTEMYMTTALVGAAVLLQAWSLIRFVEQTGRDLERFLESVRHSDFTRTFPQESGNPPFDSLHTALNEALGRFHAARAETEEQYLSLHAVVQHAGIGLVAFLPDGAVELVNPAAKRLLGAPNLRNIHDLEPSHPRLVETLLRLGPGERATVAVDDSGESAQLAVSATSVTLRGKMVSLVSLHNIRNELEEKEMEAWQNLIRVLTHEIMNSITPIASLASTARNLLEQCLTSDGSAADTETAEDIRGAIRTIEERSRGLLRFVESYRTLTRIPEPRFQVFPVRDLFDRVRRLMHERIELSGIELTASSEPESLEITADPELMEQVLINLVQNSLQALEGRPGGRIGLYCGLDDIGKTVIRVTDNGPGIEPEVVERIFIPFFTTRREGTGIGLSISRRIMSLHGGTIGVRSTPEVETVFTLRL